MIALHAKPEPMVLTVYYAAGGSTTTFHESREAAERAAVAAAETKPEAVAGWSIQPGRECTACAAPGHDYYWDAPCPICGGSGIDDRPEVR